MKKIISILLVLLVCLSVSACRRNRDQYFEKAKAEITRNMDYPKSFKVDYVKKGKVPHLSRTGFIAVDSDVVLKIKYKAKDSTGTLVHAFAYVMFDQNQKIIAMEILPFDVAVVDEFLGIK